jgi:hypothetical protein
MNDLLSVDIPVFSVLADRAVRRGESQDQQLNRIDPARPGFVRFT